MKKKTLFFFFFTYLFCFRRVLVSPIYWFSLSCFYILCPIQFHIQLLNKILTTDKVSGWRTSSWRTKRTTNHKSCDKVNVKLCTSSLQIVVLGPVGAVDRGVLLLRASIFSLWPCSPSLPLSITSPTSRFWKQTSTGYT